MSTTREFTERQRQAITAGGHTLLEAGAGSGKTTTVVGKIMHLLGAEVVPGARAPVSLDLGRIAAITFTNDAAADLRRSLREGLRAYAAAHPKERRWRQLVYDVDRVRIGTIHAFCDRVLREFALRIGLDPAYRIMDEGETGLERDECVRDALYAALERDEEVVQELVFVFSPRTAQEMIAAALQNGHAAARALDKWCRGSRGAGPGALDAKALRKAMTEHGADWREHDHLTADMAAAVLRLARDARARLDARLDASAQLDFDGLILRTRELLLNRDDALRTLRRRLDWLFIDEFQDTDPAQRDIAYRICGLDGSLAKGERAPQLCLVGDPKQSIYRFRRADVTVWKSVVEDFGKRGHAAIPLDTSFRSRRPLVDYVNATFDALMSEGSGSRHEVEFRPLVAKRELPTDDGLLELLVLPEGDADTRRKAEAELIARRIRAMVHGDEPLVYDDREKRARPPRWNEIALLFRTRTKVHFYQEALRRHGIPAYLASGDGFFRRREVRDVKLLLTALAEPYDDIAWAGVLRSPFVGLADQSLLAMRVQRPHGPLSRALDVELDGAEGERLREARAWVKELRALSGRTSVATLIERALERVGYTAHLLFAHGGGIAVANLRKLVQMADGQRTASLSDFVAYLVEREESESREPEAPLHTAGEDVVTLNTIHGAKGLEWPLVFLCDLDREVGSGAPAKKHLFDAEDGIAVDLRTKDAASGTFEHLKAEEKARDIAEEKRVWYVAATRARDHMVLCAQLPVSGGECTSEKITPAKWLLREVTIDGDGLLYRYGKRTYHGRLVEAIETGNGTYDGVRPPDAARILASAKPDAELARRIAPVPALTPLFRRSATELMLWTRDAAQHRERYLLGLRDGGQVWAASGVLGAESGNGNGTRGLEAREWGDVLHRVLENLTIDADLDLLIDRELTSQLGSGAALVPAELRERLREQIAAAWNHSAVAALRAGRHERELPFTWLVEVDGEPHLVHGAIDLIGEKDGGFELLDFKSHALGKGGESAIARDYELQQLVYAAAVRELIGAPSAFTFLFPATGKDVRLGMSERDVEAGRVKIIEALRASAGLGGEPPAAVDC